MLSVAEILLTLLSGGVIVFVTHWLFPDLWISLSTSRKFFFISTNRRYRSETGENIDGGVIKGTNTEPSAIRIVRLSLLAFLLGISLENLSGLALECDQLTALNTKPVIFGDADSGLNEPLALKLIRRIECIITDNTNEEHGEMALKYLNKKNDCRSPYINYFAIVDLCRYRKVLLSYYLPWWKDVNYCINQIESKKEKLHEWLGEDNKRIDDLISIRDEIVVLMNHLEERINEFRSRNVKEGDQYKELKTVDEKLRVIELGLVDIKSKDSFFIELDNLTIPEEELSMHVRNLARCLESCREWKEKLYEWTSTQGTKAKKRSADIYYASKNWAIFESEGGHYAFWWYMRAVFVRSTIVGLCLILFSYFAYLFWGKIIKNLVIRKLICKKNETHKEMKSSRKEKTLKDWMLLIKNTGHYFHMLIKKVNSQVMALSARIETKKIAILLLLIVFFMVLYVREDRYYNRFIVGAFVESAEDKEIIQLSRMGRK